MELISIPEVPVSSGWISVSENAQRKIASLVGEGELLRISIRGGGCTGLEYAFDLINSDDVQEDLGDMVKDKVVIDNISLSYLDGSTLDFIEKIEGAYFSFKNPKAISQCGCGKSFSATM